MGRTPHTTPRARVRAAPRARVRATPRARVKARDHKGRQIHALPNLEPARACAHTLGQPSGTTKFCISA